MASRVQAWHADLDVAAAAQEALAATLSPDERDRAARFVFERDRRRFVAARGLLRRLLGARLGVEAGRLRFGYGARGKPFLAGDDAGAGVTFNVAHSQDHALFVIASGVELGADIEVIRPLRDALVIAECHFSPFERSRLLALPPDERDVAFFLCWTRKEAYIKALGAGLAHPLEAFSVSLAPGEPARLLQDHAAVNGTPWSLHDLSRLPTYAAAVAVETAAAGLAGPVMELQADGEIPTGVTLS